MNQQEKLLRNPNFHSTNFRGQIARVLREYMRANNLKQNDLADHFGVNKSYISQIINGNCNFTIRKLFEFAVKLDLLPQIEFKNLDSYILETVKYTHAVSTTMKVAQSKFSGYEDGYAMYEIAQKCNSSID